MPSSVSCARALSILALAALAGCGQSGTSAPPQVAAGQSRASGAGRQIVVAAPVVVSSHASAGRQFRDFANAVNLQPADLPGFVVKHRETSRIDTSFNAAFGGGPQYRRCEKSAKQPSPTMTAVSPKLGAGKALSAVSISSEVQILKRGRSARQSIEAAKGYLEPKVLSCIANTFDSLGKHAQTVHAYGGTMRVTLGGMRLAPVDVGAAPPGTEGGFGTSVSIDVAYHFTIRGRSFTVPVKLYLDGLAFGVGRAVVSLGTISFGHAFPAAPEARLYSLLISRATAAARRYPAVLDGPHA